MRFSRLVKRRFHVIIDARAPFHAMGLKCQIRWMALTGYIPGAVHPIFMKVVYTVDGPKSVKILEAEYYNEIPPKQTCV